jgi:hypothetical protein
MNDRPTLKLLGLDFELSNAIKGQGQVELAAKMLLQEIAGYPQRSVLGGTPIEYGRRYLASTGGSAYIDSSHLELNLPEHTDAADHPVILHASLRLARKAQLAAEQRHGVQIYLIANCSDGQTTWGSHLNILVHRETFQDLMGRKPHLAGFFITHLVTSVVYSGQGMVGAANGRANCDYQLSQRLDWFEEFYGVQTTHARPLMNQRAEHLSGATQARLHSILPDMTLAPIATYLRVGSTQLVLAMIESGWCDPCLQLDNPVADASGISRDLSLRQPFRTAVRGREMTAVEIQAALADLAGEFVDSGAAEGIVPGAEKIVETWQEMIRLLRARDLEALAARTDCWMKFLLIDRMRRSQSLSWSSAEAKSADLMYGSLGEDGLFFRMAAAGHVIGMPTEAQLAHFMQEPPEETRAYLRAHLLRRFGEHVVGMNWDQMRFRVSNSPIWYSEAVLEMPDPLSCGRWECGPILQRSSDLEELLESLTSAPFASS